MRKSLVFGHSNRADVDDARYKKQGESEIHGNRDGDGQPSVRKNENGKLARCASRCGPCQPMARPKAQPVEQIYRDTAVLIHASAFVERVYHRRRRLARFHEAHD
jgi:hypothetical protein